MSHYPEDRTEQTKSIELTHPNVNISDHILKRISELGHPYSRKILEQAGAIQAATDLWPVLGIPMETGDFHCAKYDNYNDEPPYNFRFISAKLAENKKGRPRKTKLGLIGVNKKTLDGPVIWLTEGFWDYLTLLEAGLPVWAVPGARNLLPAWMSKFKDKDVVICFDNDNEGDRWAMEHAKKLSLVAKSVTVIHLPNAIKGKTTKDVSDIRREFKEDPKKLRDYLTKIYEKTAPFDFPIIDKIRELILGKGSSIVKAEIITDMIIEDLAKQSGLPLPFNDGQELALIIKGKDILADRAIDTMLSNKYNFLPTLDVWKSVRGLLYNNALRAHGSVNIHTYSTYANERLHFGLKGEGILSVSSKGQSYGLQGDEGIFIKSPNKIAFDSCPSEKDATVTSLDDLLNVLKFDEDILSQAEQVHLIKVWFYNTFFNFDTMQPILCAIGESGSGKSQLFKFLKGILFGFGHKRNYMLNVIPEDDHERSLLLKGKKYLFFDEVNENSPKIKKFLRTMATGIEETFRPKYERHNIEFIPDAWLAINGLNLVSSREYDIAKRLCLVKLEPLSTQALTERFGPEYIMYQKLNAARPLIWKNMLLEIQTVLGSMKKHSKQFIKLDTPCRFMGLANFAWQAWPDKETRAITHSLFSKMEGLQSHHSADMDPMMDIISEWVETEAINYSNPEEEGQTKCIQTKTMFRELQPLAKEHGVKYFPKSEKALGQWFGKREVVLWDAVGYERIKNLSTKNNEHQFKIPEKGKGGMF